MDQQPPNTPTETPAEPNADKSPIRPKHPNPPKPKVNPTVARPSKPKTPTGSLSETQEIQLAEKAEQAIETLRQKMATVAEEYADGKINKAQFNAIYRHYSEQRAITEGLLKRNPASEAWQAVVQPGQTGFLRDYYAAKIASYGLYRLKDGWQIALQGEVRLPQQQLLPIVLKVRDTVGQGHRLGPAWRQLKDQNWVFIVPGMLTMSVVIFSLEPALVQRKKVEDAHRDFERANHKILERETFDAETLVFPHRALLESS